MTTAYKDTNVIYDKGMAHRVDQLIDKNGVAVAVDDITAGNVASGTFAGAVTVGTTLGVTGATTLSSTVHAVGAVTNDSTLTQTGLASFTLMPKLPRSTIAATGTNLATAAQLVAGVITVTGADGTVGVKLPATPAAGTWLMIKNNAAAVLKVYPDAAATINAIGSNGAISMASLTSAILFADSTTQWFTIPLLPS